MYFLYLRQALCSRLYWTNSRYVPSKSTNSLWTPQKHGLGRPVINDLSQTWPSIGPTPISLHKKPWHVLALFAEGGKKAFARKNTSNQLAPLSETRSNRVRSSNMHSKTNSHLLGPLDRASFLDRYCYGAQDSLQLAQLALNNREWKTQGKNQVWT